MVQWVQPDQQAPDFSLPDDQGRAVRLSDFRGSPVVLYFYPRDETPGCTKEACAFRDRNAELARQGAVVLGISPDSVESHREFRDKFKLNFPLLADTEHEVAEQYGAWREKVRFGKRTMGIERSTFLIDPAGRVSKVWHKVQVDGHDQHVLEAIRQLNAEPDGGS